MNFRLMECEFGTMYHDRLSLRCGGGIVALKWIAPHRSEIQINVDWWNCNVLTVEDPPRIVKKCLLCFFFLILVSSVKMWNYEGKLPVPFMMKFWMRSHKASRTSQKKINQADLTTIWFNFEIVFVIYVTYFQFKNYSSGTVSPSPTRIEFQLQTIQCQNIVLKL